MILKKESEQFKRDEFDLYLEAYPSNIKNKHNICLLRNL